MALPEPQAKTAFERSISIAWPIDEVWALMTDWSLAGQWWPHVLEVEGPHPVRRGDMLTFSYQGTPSSASIDVADGPRRLVIRRVNGSVAANFDYRLESDTDSTTVNLHASLVAEHALRLVAPLLRRSLARTDRNQLDLLSQLADARGESPS